MHPLLSNPFQKQIRSFFLAAAAGTAIAVGGTIYLSVDNKVIGALLFTTGLYSICLHGLNLYTGKVGYLVDGPVSYLFDLLVIWAGNLAGTALAAAAIKATRINGICEAAAALSAAKINDGFLSLFLLSVFCGLLMFIAVDGYKTSKNPAILFMGVSAFILCGFEHCIADMFYFSLGGAWSPQAFSRILVITLGNSAGGVLIPLIKKIPQEPA